MIAGGPVNLPEHRALERNRNSDVQFTGGLAEAGQDQHGGHLGPRHLFTSHQNPGKIGLRRASG